MRALSKVARLAFTTSKAHRGVTAAASSVQNGTNGFASTSVSSLPTTLLAAACGGAVVGSVALCEEPKKLPESTKRPPNPLATGALSEDDVDKLVDSILQDPKMNIQLLPDYLERQIYKSTIQLFLASVYDSIGAIHGTQLLSHEIQLISTKDPQAKEQVLGKLSTDVDEEVLEAVADRLLSDKQVNLPLVPDAIERKLYVNCLKLIFRTLDMLASSLRLSICGHTFGFTVERTTKEELVRQAAQRAATSAGLTQVDMEVLKKYASKVGVQDHDATEMNWRQKLFDAPSKEFISQIHAAMYGLILSIIDDLFVNTQLNVLADKIEFDIVPAYHDHLADATTDDTDAEMKDSNGIGDATESVEKSGNTSSSLLPTATFVAGVGAGAILATLLSSPR